MGRRLVVERSRAVSPRRCITRVEVGATRKVGMGVGIMVVVYVSVWVGDLWARAALRLW